MCRFAVILMDVYMFKLTLDQRRMEEIIANLTKMRFGDQEQTKFKDTKEVQNIFTLLDKPAKAPLRLFFEVFTCDCSGLLCCFIPSFTAVFQHCALVFCTHVCLCGSSLQGGSTRGWRPNLRPPLSPSGRHSSSEKTLRYRSHLQH